CFDGPRHFQDLHSFPTRRSSDLTLASSIRWQTSDHFSAYASYNQTKGAQTFNLRRLSFSGSSLTGGLNYRAGKRAQFGLRYTQQIGRASCRERGEMRVVLVTLNR